LTVPGEPLPDEITLSRHEAATLLFALMRRSSEPATATCAVVSRARHGSSSNGSYQTFPTSE